MSLTESHVNDTLAERTAQLVARQAVRLESKRICGDRTDTVLYVDAAFHGERLWCGTVGGRLAREYVTLQACDHDTDEVLYEVSFPNPLYVRSLDQCIDLRVYDGEAASVTHQANCDRLVAAAVQAVLTTPELLLRCAIAHREWLLSQRRGGTEASRAVLHLVRHLLDRMGLSFDTATLARFGSTRYLDTLRAEQARAQP